MNQFRNSERLTFMYRKIINIYLEYELNYWAIFLFTRSAIRRKFFYNVYKIAFDRSGSQNFGNEFAWNVVIFDVYKNSLRYSENYENNLLVLGERPIDDINDSIGEPVQNVQHYLF